MQRKVEATDHHAPAGKLRLEPPRLERLGTLKELTKAFTGAGNDTFIVGMSHN